MELQLVFAKENFVKYSKRLYDSLSQLFFYQSQLVSICLFFFQSFLKDTCSWSPTEACVQLECKVPKAEWTSKKTVCGDYEVRYQNLKSL